MMMRHDHAQVVLPFFMISVNDKRRMKWDMMIILLALYNCVTIPLNAAFTSEMRSSDAIDVLERVIDVLFFFDIIMNFRTTFINPKTNIEISDNKRVFITYFQSLRFPVDVLASVPFDLFFNSDRTISVAEHSGTTVHIQLIGLLKLIRLLRLGRIVTYMKVNASLKIGFRIF